MLRLPLETELSAACVAAAQAGLGLVRPEVMHLGNHTTVRLHPWPIVARIASGTSFDFSDASIARELIVAAHLASRDAPSIRPAPNVAPGPYFESDCAITLWQLLDGRPVASQDEEFLAARSLGVLHSALDGIDADLPSFITKVQSCETILTNPAEAPKLALDDRLFLERLYEKLSRELPKAGGAWQALHGDSHLGNVLMTNSGAIWMDLEACCVGPVEWDVVNLPEPSWSLFSGVDISALRFLADVRSLCLAVWCWAEFDRSHASKEAAICHLGELKDRFT